MKFRPGACLLLLFGMPVLMTACGGGGGSGGTPIAVTSAKNPVLVNRSTTIVASFAPYTSANQVRIGSVVTFTVSAPGTVASATAVTQAGGIATTSVKSSQAATVTVTASSGGYAGATTVSFIPMPATAKLSITPAQALSNIGGFQFNVTNDVPVTFTGFTNISSGWRSLGITNPVASTNNVTLLTAELITGSSITFGTTVPLFNLFYTVPSGATDVPNFKIDPKSVMAVFTNLSTVRPTPTLTLSPVYYDSNGKTLFP